MPLKCRLLKKYGTNKNRFLVFTGNLKLYGLLKRKYAFIFASNINACGAAGNASSRLLRQPSSRCHC
jgi:hypothetical protein